LSELTFKLNRYSILIENSTEQRIVLKRRRRRSSR
jgi:hypothetical protein